MCKNCEWLAYLNLCDEMLLDESYDFASETIESISGWIKTNEHVTEKQKDAIDNIRECVFKQK